MTWPLTKPPYRVQTRALEEVKGRHGYGYFMEMGLGKTAVVLAEFLSLHRQQKVAGLIVICPNSLKETWRNEVEKMGAAIKVVGIWPELPKTFDHPWMLVMNYEATITKAGHECLTKALRAKCMFVLDESIQIKNPKARRTRILIALSKEAPYRRILSGAPLVQGPHDLWAQLRFLGLLNDYNFYAFRNTFCLMGGYMGKQIVGTQNASKLNKIINSTAFRAKKEDWLDLPKKIYTTRHITLNPTQLKHYKEMKRDMITMVRQQEIEAQMVITQMLKLQQIGSGFIIDEGGQTHDLGGTAKMDVVDEILDEVSGKVLIFTYFRHSARLLYDKHKANAELLIGGLSTDEVARVKRRFESDPSCRVLICQTATGKYGHTFLGGEGDARCATTIFYENSFSLDDRLQAEDRNHRIGQDRSVVYVDIVATDVDSLAVSALQRKMNVADEIIDGLRGSNAHLRSRG